MVCATVTSPKPQTHMSRQQRELMPQQATTRPTRTSIRPNARIVPETTEMEWLSTRRKAL